MKEQDFKSLYKKGMEPSDFEEEAGDIIAYYIETELDFNNGYKELPEEEEDEMYDGFSWKFTQKGEILYRKEVEKACKVFKKHFPEETCKIEEHTGVIYP